MRIIVLGAGHVGTTVVEALFDDHELTVVDRDPARLSALANLFDVRTVEGNGASRAALEEAGVAEADLLIASTARDEVNLVAAMLVRRLSGRARTLVRTTDVEHLRAWREGVLDVDFMVSSELETATAVFDAIAVPGARHTDVFADGQVVIAEFDVTQEAAACRLLDQPLAQAPLPADSRIAVIVRDDRLVLPRGDERLRLGDRPGAQHALETARDLMPTLEGLLDLALVHQLSGDVGAEVTACEAATVLAPESLTAWSRYAHALARTDRVSDAIAAAEHAMDLGTDPEVAALLLTLRDRQPRALTAESAA